jgi:hypothetical protein
MLGGGYALSSGVNVERAAVIENYPASVDAWTVTVSNASDGGPLTLTAYADCLLSQFPVTTQIVVTTLTVPNDESLHTFGAACPVGTTATGGGYRDGGFSGGPTEHGWQATFIPRGENPPPSVRVFAICARHNLQVGSIAVTSHAIEAGGSATLIVACSSGELLVGGGYSYNGLPANAYVDEPASDFAAWQVELADQGIAGGQGSGGILTASAVCVRIALGSVSG